jgi:hypothetical protein
LIQPAFKRLQNQAQLLVCSNQQKTLMGAGAFLLEDKNDTFPLGGYISGLPNALADESIRVTVEGEATHYVGAFAQYLELPVRLDSKSNHYNDLRDSDNFDLFLCPMDTFSNMPTLLLHKTDSSLSLMSGTGGRAFTSYGTNEYFTGYYKGYSGAAGMLNLVQQPSKVFFMADAQAPSTYDYNVLRSSGADTATLFDMLSSDFSKRLAFERHEQQVVVSFIDGHVLPFHVSDLDQVWLSKGISR